MQTSRREQAVQLRLAGLSRSQIAEALGLAAGGGEPLTTWLRDVPAPAWTRRPRAKDDLRETAVAMRELFVAGVVAYWGEGSKNKPWRFGQGVIFINSDAGFIQLFLRWLALVGVEQERLCFRLMIHESADIPASLSYWSSVVAYHPRPSGRPS